MSDGASARPAARGNSRAAAPRRPRRLARELAALGALGVLAAAILTVCSNVLVARFYQRWDVTSAGLYTLSRPTLETLHGLSEPVQIIVLLGSADPDYAALERVLAQYRAESRLVEVRHVDPDRDPAEYLALASRLRLGEAVGAEGRLIEDAALVLTRGEARWVVGADDLRSYDEGEGLVQPRLEQAITEGLRQVLDPTSLDVCFTAGHGEPSPDDGGPVGLGALSYMLRRNNYETREVDLGASGSEAALAACELVVLVAPRERVSAPVAERLAALARRGQALLVALGPALDADERTVESGLGPLLEAFGARLEPGLIFERDPGAVLPVGLGGEAFLATPRAHAVTQGLLNGAEVRQRVLVQLAQAVAEGLPVGGAAAAKVAPLLVTSERAFSVRDAARLAEGGVDIESLPRHAQGPFTVALAAELPAGAAAQRPARMVLIGSPSPLLGATWEDGSLAGTRRFVESAIGWLSARPSLVSVPEKPGRRAELRFTEESLGEVVRYVLLYMPGTALALGAWTLLRRRSGGRRRKAAREAS